MLNIRNLIVSVALVALLLLAIPLATARTEVISDPSRDVASVSNHPKESASQNAAARPSYRDPLDECFDVPISQAAACRAEGRSLVPTYRSKLDECSDVGLMYRAQCLKESQESTP